MITRNVVGVAIMLALPLRAAGQSKASAPSRWNLQGEPNHSTIDFVDIEIDLWTRLGIRADSR